jgi:hypothetical protein
MNRPARPLPAPWIFRLGTPEPLRPMSQRPAPLPAASRPGIAGRWKPRDRVSSAGN